MKRVLWIFILLFSFNMLVSAQVQFIESEKSHVEFEVKKFKMFNVDGTIKGMKGTIRFDSTNLDNSSFMVCIEPSSIETGIKKRDNHLKSADFFDVEQYDKICFTSEIFKKTSEGYVVEGLLGIRDLSKNVSIPFTFKNKVFQGTFEINRLDFGVGKETSKFMAGNKIEVKIACHVK